DRADGFVKGRSGGEGLRGLAFDLKNCRALCDVADDGARMKMAAGLLAWGEADFADVDGVDVAIAEERLQQRPAFDGLLAHDFRMRGVSRWIQARGMGTGFP